MTLRSDREYWDGRTPDQEYDEFWKDLVTTDGALDPEKVKAELHDYGFMMSQVSALYMELSGGAISKQNTYAFEVINQYRRRHGEEALEFMVDDTQLEDQPADVVARLFHQHYERLAPLWGYKTREASATEWDDVPVRNRELMTATAQAVIDELTNAEPRTGRTVRIETKDDVDYMDIGEFRDIGLVHEVNRQLLHPLGMAMEVQQDGCGRWYVSGIWDVRDDPEGVNYGPDILSAEKAHQVAELMLTRKDGRQVLGYVTQPVEPLPGRPLLGIAWAYPPEKSAEPIGG